MALKGLIKVSDQEKRVFDPIEIVSLVASSTPQRKTTDHDSKPSLVGR